MRFRRAGTALATGWAAVSEPHGRRGLRRASHFGEDPGLRGAGESSRGLSGCPDGLFEKALETCRLLDAVEVQRDIDVLVVVDRLMDAMRADPGLLAGLLEPVEGTQPDLEIADRMLDVEKS